MDISIHVTSALTNSERRVSPAWTVSHLKSRLETITGIPPAEQQLLLFPSIDSKSIEIQDGLCDFITKGCRIHVNDMRPLEEEGEEVETFELDDEEYDKLTNSVRRWKKENQLGRFNPQLEQKRKEADSANELKASAMQVGSRFQTDGDRRGLIKFVGKVPEIDNKTWVGVEFDEPVGKNDGSIKGVYYFQTLPLRGSFLKPNSVQVGDFPPIDLFDEI